MLSLAGTVKDPLAASAWCLPNKDVGGKDSNGSLNDDKNPTSSLS